MTDDAKNPWLAIVRELGPTLAASAAAKDAEGSFAEEAYRLFADRRLFSMAIPEELGGGGASFFQVCDTLRELGTFDGSSALALSMHTHLIAASVWKYRHDKSSEALLRKIAKGQLALVSTGASDWIDSNGTMSRVEGGFRVSARKIFGSGSPAAALMIASARYEDPQDGAQVLHFGVPLSAEGVSSAADWDAHGMRRTGSHTLILENVFVPDQAISLRRPAGQWHPAWSVVLTVAPPIYMSPYVGIAEKAAELARSSARASAEIPYVPLLAGETEVELAATRLAWRALVANANEYDFAPALETANAQLVNKALCARAAVATVEKAMELAGGRGFFRRFGLERLLRDVRAAPYHPLPDKRQQEFSGRLALGRDPITNQPRSAP
jgi:alkylation response protein AidB-like acyl-CoA dehydrogenase